MSNTRELIDAIESGDSIAIESAFEASMASRIADRMDTMRQEVAQNMFKEAKVESTVAEEAEQVDEAADASKVGANHLHVQHVGGGKYKVHAVGKNFADGIKVGEHLSDSELDDFQEMGGKVKNVK